MRNWEVQGGLGGNFGRRGEQVVWRESWCVGGRIWMREEWVGKRELGED